VVDVVDVVDVGSGGGLVVVVVVEVGDAFSWDAEGTVNSHAPAAQSVGGDDVTA